MKRLLTRTIPIFLVTTFLVLIVGTTPVHANGGPAVSLSTSSIDFGDVEVGSASTTETVTVTNTGSTSLIISSYSTTGDFGAWNCWGATLAPSTSCDITVIFYPSSTGPKTGTLSILTNAPSSPDTVDLSGNGIASEIQVTPSPLNFGNQLVGTPATRTVTVNNIGLADLHMGTLSITGTGFTLSDNLCDNVTLVPAGSCTFEVIFDPSSVGGKTGEVSIPSDSGGVPSSDEKSNIYYTPVITLLPLFGNGILAQTNLIFRSSGGYDGTVRESSKDSRVGGFNEPISALISVGDDYLNRQYIGILHFNTARIPDNAVITRARIQVKGMILSNTTYTRLGELSADVMKPNFGTFTGLENLDFQAPALARNIGTFTHAPTYYKWVTLNMKPASLFAINKSGTTQFRLHFAKKYYNDNIKQMFRFLSGDFWIPADFPKLIVTYYIP